MTSQPQAAITIGGRLLGPGYRPLIIAEMSGNHNRNLERALRIVRMAAESGADAIKLQTYTPGSLTIDSTRPEFFIDDPASLWHGQRLWDLYQEAHTPWEWHAPIFEAARAAGLACISTAYDFSSLDALLSFGVDAIKIASFELVHLPLIERAARSGKPLLLSTGMADLAELDAAVAALRANGGDRFILLKCTSAYPSAEADANLLTMADMRQRYACDVGLSDHNLRPYAAFAAAALGAVAIEKHFTTARADGGVDAPFSIEPAELRELVDGTASVWRSLGAVHYAPLAAEAASLKERPSIFVMSPMKRGDRFTEQNLRIIRPASGLAPKYYDWLIGRPCACDIAGESPMTWAFVTGPERPA